MDITHRFFKVKASALNDSNKRVAGVGQVCVAVRPVRGTKNAFKVAFSFKSPADKFQPELSEKIADGRLDSKRVGRNFRIDARNVDSAIKKAFSEAKKTYKMVGHKRHRIKKAVFPYWYTDALELGREVTAVPT